MFDVRFFTYSFNWRKEFYDFTQPYCAQRTGIAAGVEFIECPAQNRYPIKK
jgi:hypothetical protein